MTKIATWNVNSLKIRLEQVLAWLQETGVHILALQETKLIDTDFPLQVFKDLGYTVSYAGQKSYNGVAIISRDAQENIVSNLPDFEDPQRRFLAATINGLRIVNVYVPNGALVGSEKFSYKLQWLENLTRFLENELKTQENLALVGDFNIAPEDRDVHDPIAWAGKVLVSREERQAFAKLLSLNLIDSFRLFPQTDNCYTWWDYRAGSFRRNHGLRIDHLLLSKTLSSTCKAVIIDKAPRKAERPSDHSPVICEFL